MVTAEGIEPPPRASKAQALPLCKAVSMVGEEGIEPPCFGSEPNGLPLSYSPVKEGFRRRRIFRNLFQPRDGTDAMIRTQPLSFGGSSSPSETPV